MKVFILLGSDDYQARQVLAVYASRANAQQAIKDKRWEEHQSDGCFRLICRQGEPHYDIVEREVL